MINHLLLLFYHYKYSHTNIHISFTNRQTSIITTIVSVTTVTFTTIINIQINKQINHYT